MSPKLGHWFCEAWGALDEQPRRQGPCPLDPCSSRGLAVGQRPPVTPVVSRGSLSSSIWGVLMHAWHGEFQLLLWERVFPMGFSSPLPTILLGSNAYSHCCPPPGPSVTTELLSSHSCFLWGPSQCPASLPSQASLSHSQPQPSLKRAPESPKEQRKPTPCRHALSCWIKPCLKHAYWSAWLFESEIPPAAL